MGRNQPPPPNATQDSDIDSGTDSDGDPDGHYDDTPKTHHFQLREYIIAHSVANEWALARLEWELLDVVRRRDSHCICKMAIMFRYRLQNIHNNHRCIMGSSCVRHFERADLDLRAKKLKKRLLDTERKQERHAIELRRQQEREAADLERQAREAAALHALQTELDGPNGRSMRTALKGFQGLSMTFTVVETGAFDKSTVSLTDGQSLVAFLLQTMDRDSHAAMPDGCQFTSIFSGKLLRIKTNKQIECTVGTTHTRMLRIASVDTRGYQRKQDSTFGDTSYWGLNLTVQPVCQTNNMTRYMTRK